MIYLPTSARRRLGRVSCVFLLSNIAVRTTVFSDNAWGIDFGYTYGYIKDSAVDMSLWIHKVNGVVYNWYAGVCGGRAVADVLTGRVSGRLPILLYQFYSVLYGNGVPNLVPLSS